MRAGGRNEPERPFLPVSQHLIPCLQAPFPLLQSLSFFVSYVLLLVASDFDRQLRLLASLPDFHSKEGETGIFSMGGEQSEDFAALLNAARNYFSTYFMGNMLKCLQIHVKHNKSYR